MFLTIERPPANADLEGSGGVRRTDVAEALIYRRIAPGLGTGVVPAV